MWATSPQLHDSSNQYKVAFRHDNQENLAGYIPASQKALPWENTLNAGPSLHVSMPQHNHDQQGSLHQGEVREHRQCFYVDVRNLQQTDSMAALHSNPSQEYSQTTVEKQLW